MGAIDIGIVFFLVKEVSIAYVLIGIVTSHGVGRHLLIGVSEVDVPHIVLIVQEIRVQSIVIPEVVLVILAFPVTLNHEVQELGHTVADVRPKHRS